jgi:anti-anti-sigma factor
MLDIVMAASQRGGRHLLRLTGQLTSGSASALRTIRFSARDDVEFDMSGVEEMDRPGLGALMAVVLRLRRMGVSCRLSGTGPELLKMMRMEGLDRLVRLEGGVA